MEITLIFLVAEVVLMDKFYQVAKDLIWLNRNGNL